MSPSGLALLVVAAAGGATVAVLGGATAATVVGIQATRNRTTASPAR